jgi:hypothetical protein
VAQADFHDFYVASASVTGALIGLLFVAISVRPERIEEDRDTHAHRVRASAALTAFVNALAVSLFALVPGQLLGGTAVVVSIFGLMFVVGSLMSIVRVRGAHVTEFRDTAFLIALLAVFVIQLSSGLNLTLHAHDESAQHTIGVLVIVCLLIGIPRSWELIGGPEIGLFHEVARMRQRHRRPAETAEADADATSDGPEPTSDRQPDPWSG